VVESGGENIARAHDRACQLSPATRPRLQLAAFRLHHCVIERDDSSHQKASNQRRDEFVDKANSAECASHRCLIQTAP
jgi:hypothetical protein